MVIRSAINTWLDRDPKRRSSKRNKTSRPNSQSSRRKKSENSRDEPSRIVTAVRVLQDLRGVRGTNILVRSMQVMANSICNTTKVLNNFNMVASLMGTTANMYSMYHGTKALNLIAGNTRDMSRSLAAMTALQAQEKFPAYVHYMIRERLGETMDDRQCDHWFFLYHPDNDWYPEFCHLLETNPVGPRFCGYTDQIDTAFAFMLAARQCRTRKEERAKRKGQRLPHLQIHLLIPAYQQILIAEALRIPSEIGDFVMEGRINSTKPFVWLNLPKQQRHYVKDIGHWVPPTQDWLGWGLTKFGWKDEPLVLTTPRLLGSGRSVEWTQNTDDDRDSGYEGNSSDTDGGSPSRASRRRDARPLQEQHCGHRSEHRSQHRGDSHRRRDSWPQDIPRTRHRSRDRTRRAPSRA